MINVFFSYSHADERLRNELEKHLSILKRQAVISTWHDRRIDAGSELHAEISSNLKNAQIVLLLVSADFLSSDYCYDVELKEALAMHERGDAVVIPVILRPCDWHSAPFGKLLATPLDGKPVEKFSSLDEAFLEITTAIKKVITNKISRNETIASRQALIESTPLPRSSNLRIRKTFTDRDKDQFMDEAFIYISNYFEGSLAELKKRNPEIDSRFKRIDSQCFTAIVYRDGRTVSECMIYIGGSFGNNSISYSSNISNARNSMNNSVTLADEGETLQLRPGPMNIFGRNRDSNLTNEGAAEMFWEVFISPLQRL
jgi:hypothetical protein